MERGHKALLPALLSPGYIQRWMHFHQALTSEQQRDFALHAHHIHIHRSSHTASSLQPSPYSDLFHYSRYGLVDVEKLPPLDGNTSQDALIDAILAPHHGREAANYP